MTDPVPAQLELSEDEREILRVGCAYYDEAGTIDNEIRGLGLTWVKFYQRLNALLDTERALAGDPVNVNRMRRLRAARMRKRA